MKGSRKAWFDGCHGNLFFVGYGRIKSTLSWNLQEPCCSIPGEVSPLHSGFSDFVQSPMSVEQRENCVHKIRRSHGYRGWGRGGPKLAALQVRYTRRLLPNLTDLGSDSSGCKNLDKLDSLQHLVDII